MMYRVTFKADFISMSGNVEARCKEQIIDYASEAWGVQNMVGEWTVEEMSHDDLQANAQDGEASFA